MVGLISVDAQFFQTPDGEVWTKTMYEYHFWDRYLNVFDSIDVVSRMKIASFDEVKGYLKSSGPRVKFKGLPMAIGTKEYLRHWKAFTKGAQEAVKGERCAVLRVPSVSSLFVEAAVRKRKIPYAIEVVVDPEDAYVDNKMAKVFLTHRLKNSAFKANGVSYVTQFALQQKYPSCARLHGDDFKHFESYYSSILLRKSYFTKPRNYMNHGRKYKIIHVANNFNNYIKGHKEVIEILSQLLHDGYDVNVEFIGDGTKRKEFENFASDLGVREKVNFIGLLSSPEAVRQELLSADDCHVFLLQ